MPKVLVTRGNLNKKQMREWHRAMGVTSAWDGLLCKFSNYPRIEAAFAIAAIVLILVTLGVMMK